MIKVPDAPVPHSSSPDSSRRDLPARHADGLRVGLLVPTCNAGPRWPDWLQALQTQTRPPDEVLVIDSASDDATPALARQAGLPVHAISRAEFDHGATRQLGVSRLATCDVVVCLTQDAVLASPQALQYLLAAFADSAVAAAWGRQLPHPEATPLAAHARLFNYPPVSRAVCWQDRAQLGLKAAFCSNSFAAWRVAPLLQAGGFPDDTLLAEDMLLAARLLLAGGKVAYVAESAVQHSHNYSLGQEFRRYFDTGALHALQPWLLQSFGAPGGEGLRFVLSEQRYVAAAGWCWRLRALAHTAAKWFGYQAGRRCQFLPGRWAARLSLHPAWWLRRSGGKVAAVSPADPRGRE